MSRLIVIGAGAERHLGMPLADELVPELAKFTSENGSGFNINKKLREKVKNLRFDFQSFVQKSVNEFLEKQIQNPELNVEALQKIKDKHPDESSGKIDFLIDISQRIQDISRSNEIDADFASKIEQVIGAEVSDESLIKLRGIELTDDPQKAIHTILRDTVYGIDLHNDLDRDLQNYILRTIFPFEKLLMENFTGFYTGHQASKKKYLFMSWCLWAYLRVQMNDITETASNSAFYRQINSCDDHIITFNYTNFFTEQKLYHVSYFHGDCMSYIKYSNRDFITSSRSDLVKEANTPEKVWEMLDSLNFDIEKNDFPLPAIVPPLTFKPVFSSHYIRKWAEAGEALENSRVVIIIGYSFAQADEHFNDLLRRSARDKRVYVVDPSVDTAASRCARIFGMSGDFEKTTMNGMPARIQGELIALGGRAEELDLSSLS